MPAILPQWRVDVLLGNKGEMRETAPTAVLRVMPEMPEFPPLRDAAIPELPNHYRGKVRENYDLADGRRIIIATDRLSAFDRAIACIPFKGQVLTQTARFWFERTADICPNHAIEYPDPNVVGRRLDILAIRPLTSPRR